MAGHLLLVDGSTFAYRAFFALKETRRADGLPTHAIIGFMAIVYRMIARAEADPYDYGAVVFDHPGPTFRHRLFKDYKAQRSRPEDLTVQLPIMREAARTLGLAAVEHKGFEADDVLATLARQAKERGIRTTIVTIDKDLYQLVEDGVVEIADPVQRCRVLEADVVAKFGVPPNLVADVQALCGDPVDNYPGVRGVGPKIAARLIRKYGSLKAVMVAGTSLRGDIIYGPIRKDFERAQADVWTFRKLASLRADVPLKVTLDELRPAMIVPSHIRDMLRLLEAPPGALAQFGLSPDMPDSVERDPEPLRWWEEELAVPGQQVPPTPQCGFYFRRYFLGGPTAPVRIWREPEKDFETEEPTGRDVILCEVERARKNAYDQWGFVCANPITRKDYDALLKAPPKRAPEPLKSLPPVRYTKRRRRAT